MPRPRSAHIYLAGEMLKGSDVLTQPLTFLPSLSTDYTPIELHLRFSFIITRS